MALRGLGRVLVQEVRDAPHIHVCTISPGAVDTPIYLQAANYAGRAGRPPPPVTSPERVARAILRTTRHPRRERLLGPATRVMALGFTVTPPLYDLLVTPLMEVAGLSRRRVPPGPGTVFTPRPEGDRVHGRWGRHWLQAVGPLAAAVAAGSVAAARRRRDRDPETPRKERSCG